MSGNMNYTDKITRLKLAAHAYALAWAAWTASKENHDLYKRMLVREEELKLAALMASSGRVPTGDLPVVKEESR